MRTLRIISGWLAILALLGYTLLVVFSTQLPERLDAQAESMEEN